MISMASSLVRSTVSSSCARYGRGEGAGGAGPSHTRDSSARAAKRSLSYKPARSPSSRPSRVIACSAPWRSASGTTLVASSSDRRLVTDPTVPDALRSQADAIQPVRTITSSWGSVGRSLINAKRNASFSRRGSICRKARAWSLNQSSAIGATCARMIGLIMSRANASVLTTEPGPTIDCICSSSDCMAHRLAACSAAIAVSAAASRHSRTAARSAPISRCGMFIGSNGRHQDAVSIRNVRSCMLIKASAWVTLRSSAANGSALMQGHAPRASRVVVLVESGPTAFGDRQLRTPTFEVRRH